MTTVYQCDGCQALFEVPFPGEIGMPHYRIANFGAVLDLCPKCDMEVSKVIYNTLKNLTPRILPRRRIMALKTKVNQPNPGSMQACEQGCTCPVLDNYHGDGIGKDENDMVMFWISDDCPLHVKPIPLKPVITPKTSVDKEHSDDL